MKPTSPGAPARPSPSHAKTMHDHLLLPGGRKVGDVPSDELRRIFEAAGVPGVSADQGRLQNVDAYAAHLGKIGDDAGKAAVAAALNTVAK